MWKTAFPGKGLIPLALTLILLLSSCSGEQKDSGGTESSANRDSSIIPDSTAPPGSPVPEIDDHRLIVPGERIGQTHIRESLEEANKRLGPADSSDAGMGHVWEYRSSTPGEGKEAHELDIYASFDEEATGHYIRQIRITSPWFVTAEGIGTGTPFEAIQSVYPGIEAVAQYDEGEKHVVYDDPQEGIGFEFLWMEGNAPGQCTGIIVHEPGRDIRNAYIPRHGYKEIGSK